MSDTRPPGQPDEAMLDLLVKQVAEGLSPDEQRALDVLDSETASAWLQDLERAAAAVTVAGTRGDQPLPEMLAARIARQAAEHFTPAATARRDGGYGRAAYGWLAAAACLVLAIFGWVRPPSLPGPPTAAQERAVLLAKSGTLKISLGATKDPAAAGVSGDVVWDPATQRGFLHFAGLAANDPAVQQYQIWIFDSGRDDRYPVDGGVFDVPANVGDIVIPIRAALMVRKPAAFAVTIEKPGGVVVSGRERVIALGATG
ncbi:MAG TPA: anti-sigma factor [Steroidobacteraceae bacterium]|jgi:anti-sigma-K factor RskA